jgi:hypothetical protein
MRQLLLRCLLMVVVLVGLTAMAQAKTDHFGATIDQSGYVTGSGTGYAGGEWFYYPDSGWWNQWFYDDPFDPNRWKLIDYSIPVQPLEPGTPGLLTLAINWSSDLYPPNPVEPPIPPIDPIMEDSWIVRQVVFDGLVDVEPILIEGQIPIREYNPEWVSIDIMGYGVQIMGGVINHVCLAVPEPATLSLLVLGSFGLMLWRRK